MLFAVCRIWIFRNFFAHLEIPIHWYIVAGSKDSLKGKNGVEVMWTAAKDAVEYSYSL